MQAFAKECAIIATFGVATLAASAGGAQEPPVKPPPPFGVQEVEHASRLMGLEFTPAELDSMQEELQEALESYGALRGIVLPNDVPPALQFNPIPVGTTFERDRRPLRLGPPRRNKLPKKREELAFWSVRDLSELVRTRQVTSTELTQLALERLKKHGLTLECVITLTEDLALTQARRADVEIAAGQYRGPLHGIPYAAKDLLAVRGYKTTWGSVPYRDQVIQHDASVIRKLEEAGAVLVAKVTLGALAWGDVWYGGMTRNPWNLAEGSSGSSAGSAAATAAGLVPFAIGTETLGSIVSPSTRCGITGLRPTFGRVSRTGAMALSWSMDKIGPICRTVEDCALVFDAIRGPDGVDATVVDLPFNYDAKVNLKTLRIGYVEAAFKEDYPSKKTDAKALQVLRGLGADLRPLQLPDYPFRAMTITLVAEAAAAFDELTRSNRDDLLVRQIKQAWPNVFRAARFIPAVEYIQAQRVRHLVIQRMADVMRDIDVYVAPSFAGVNLVMTNLTGHPCVVLPNGFKPEGGPVSISFTGRLYDEATLLAVAKAYQDATNFHDKRPPKFRE